jgi:hypothetical protein
MVDAQVRWTPYAPAIVVARAPQGLSSLCSRDQTYWLPRRRLVFDVYIEEYAVHRVLRQFGLFQATPIPAAPRLPPRAWVSYHLTLLSIFCYKYSAGNNLCFMFYARWSPKGVPAAPSFVDRL